MKTLYLLRHAKAESGDGVMRDEDRPLSARGRTACERIGAYMQSKHYTLELALCSPSLRTRETLERVGDAFGQRFTSQIQPQLYLATAGEMLAQIQAVQEGISSVLVVGHNPGMHHLASLLANAEHTSLREKLELKYPTGALTVLQCAAARWSALSPGQAVLVDFKVPGAL